jgi:branched-chain amino acid transport system permease protein
VSGSSLLLNLILEGLVQGSVYALLAVGFSLLWWVSGIIHLAHGGVTLAGGLLLYLLFEAWGLPFAVALAAAAGLTVLFGVAVDVAVYRPLLRRSIDEMGLLTASLGVLIVAEYLLTIAFGPDGVTLDADGFRRPLFGAILPVVDGFSAAVLATTAVIFLALHAVMTRSSLGRRLRAVASNPELAQVIGIETMLVSRQAAALTAILALPAAVAILFSSGLAPNEALHLVLISAVCAILGGRGSLAGALIAGLIMGVTESVTSWQFATGWRQLVTFALLYLILLARPQGLFGRPA